MVAQILRRRAPRWLPNAGSIGVQPISPVAVIDYAADACSFNVAMSMTKRYFTSPLTMRS
jgi:hypothetical protein